jgi:hypothetical protein
VSRSQVTIMTPVGRFIDESGSLIPLSQPLSTKEFAKDSNGRKAVAR